MTTQQYNRPDTATPAAGEAGLPNRTKFQDISATRPRIPISSEDIDSEFNTLIDAVNELYDTAIAGTVPDNSVTLAKLAHLTAGSMYYMDGSGVPTELAVGTSGQVLQSNGTIPVWTTSSSDVPSGVVNPYAGSSAPTGWLLCDGSAVSRSTYSALFSVISTTYGSGDGSTTFNVPDMRGRIPLAKDNMGGTSANRVTDTEADTLGSSSGSEKITPAGSISGTVSGTTDGHSLTEAEMPAHTHEIKKNSGSTGIEGVVVATNTDSTFTSESTGSGDAHTHTITSQPVSATFTGTEHTNVPPYLTLNYIIKT